MATLNPRQQSLVQMARERGYVRVDELVEWLGVTHQTVRRDINYLCEHGILSRFHGGAAFRSSVTNLPYEARRDSMADEKVAIAKAVAAEIPDHSSIFIDIGTTAEAFAAELLEKNGLKIVTNNLNVVNILAKKDDFELVVCGGTVRNRDLAIVGETTREFIDRFRLDYAILGVVAIAADGSVLDFSLDDAPFTQAVIGCSRVCFVLADHTKFGRHAMAKVAHLSQVAALYTDVLPNGDWASQLADAGVTIRVAPRPLAAEATPASDIPERHVS
ncbi:Glycerol-3-phosphate regulon repressor [Hyphomicrobiales bacterium]|nr:Glycerol-3-phosphate regulon repressor [Hyphomicrobiales bacterium]CAH1690007.1 Glycerol-3-phosphate regulon repressor [Hyphomicrobiales bacterium]